MNKTNSKNPFIGSNLVKKNPLGFYVRTDGKLFEDEDQKKEIILNTDSARV